MLEKNKSLKRVRGVILSVVGWQRLQAAKQRAEAQANAGQPYTMEEITHLVHLSHNTLIKVHQRKVPVDRQTLEIYFTALGLTLQPSDYTRSDPGQAALTQNHTELEWQQSPLNIQGPVPLNSPFYIDRPPIEQQCEQAILQPGALIRIKASQYMGKTSLMIRLLNRVRDYRMQTLVLSLRLADAAILQDLDSFLNWFCRIVTRGLDRPNRLEEYWDNLFGSSYSCTYYFEKYLLAQTDCPVVLALDDLDQVFCYPDIATHFFGLLRAWYEKAKYGDSSSYIWQKLRLVIVHSTEMYIPLSVDHSPFNVGKSVELPDFTCQQVIQLARQYELEWNDAQAQPLIQFVGGNPYLIQLALASIKQQEIPFEQFVEAALAPSSIYSNHLRQQLSYLKQYPDLAIALMQVLRSATLAELEPIQAFKLQSMGLVRIYNQQVMPSCQLYRQYFHTTLSRLELFSETVSAPIS